MNNRKKNSSGSIVIWALVLAVIFAYNAVTDADPELILPVLIGVAAVAMVVAVIVMVSRAKAGSAEQKPGAAKQSVSLHRPFPQPTAMKNRRPAAVLQHRDEAEEVISCGHKSGKQKYLEQVEGFYKNGLIDRDEYKILREKYEKLDIPEDYHRKQLKSIPTAKTAARLRLLKSVRLAACAATAGHGTQAPSRFWKDRHSTI